LPDPGSLPVDCAKAEEGIEFAEQPIWDFQSDSGFIEYSYTDGSAPPVTDRAEAMDRCAQPDNKGLHVFGGPYLGWGGGVGTSIKDWWGRVGGAVPCVSAGQPAMCENRALNPGITGRFVDASQWDGISVWARRGPEGQDGFRVTLGDKYTDDEQNIDQDVDDPNGDGVDTEQKYCKRVRLCSCHSNKPCSLWTEPETWPDGRDNSSKGTQHHLCYDERFDPPIKGLEKGKTQRDSAKFVLLLPQYVEDVPVEYCAEEACNQPFAAGGADPAINGRACTPFQFQSGENASYCFDAGQDPNPPENYERCGDHWQTPVRLSTDWQLFLVPFSDMRQQGYGKESRKLLTDQLSVFRLTWEGGFVDTYIDDVRFYRVKR
jgi:hypothetical protein